MKFVSKNWGDEEGTVSEASRGNILTGETTGHTRTAIVWEEQMSREILKDRNFRIIGYIDTDSQGKKKILDPNYRVLGYFDPRTNRTTDANYRTIGNGDLLATFLR